MLITLAAILRWRVKIASIKSWEFLFCHPQLDYILRSRARKKMFPV